MRPGLDISIPMMRLVRGFPLSSGNSISSFKLTVPDWSVSSLLNLPSEIDQSDHQTQNIKFYLLDNLEISATVKFVDWDSWEVLLPMMYLYYLWNIQRMSWKIWHNINGSVECWFGITVNSSQMSSQVGFAAEGFSTDLTARVWATSGRSGVWPGEV